MFSKDTLTTIFGAIASSAVFQAGYQKFSTDGFTFESVWLMLGGIAGALWAYWTNKH